MNPAGIGLVLITLAIVIAMIICNKWIRKVTNTYFFWAAIGAFFFIWMLVFRFVPEWQEYINTPEKDDLIISRAFLLDACPFFCLATCVSCFADPTRKVARSIAPIALVGGIITIGALPFDASTWGGPSFTAQYIFLGDEINPCYFIMHFIQIVIPVGIMLNSPKNGWKGWVLTLLIAITYYVYVGITAKLTGCQSYVSGLNINDWLPSGEYFAVHEIFSFIPIQAMPYIGIPFLYIVASVFTALKDYVFSKGHWRYGNAYSGKWYAWYNYNKFVKQGIL